MNIRTLCVLTSGWALIGCLDPPPQGEVAADVSLDSSADVTPPDAPSGPVYVTPPDECTAPAALPDDPIVLSHEVGLPIQGLHLLDITRDPVTGTVWTVGRGGLIALDTDGHTSTFAGKHPAGLQVFEHLELLADGVIAVTNRGDNSKGAEEGFWGLGFINAADPASMKLLGRLELEDAGDLARAGSVLYVLTFSGSLAVVDVTPQAPASLLTEVPGLDTPWGIALSGDHAYIADNGLGVVVVDITTPTAPVIGASVETSGSALGVAVDDAHLVVAAGSAGVDIFSLADPAAPVFQANVDVGAAVVSVAVSGGTVWATTQESLAAIDVRAPAAPVLLNVESTPSWAMGVYAEGSRAWVADWNDVRVYDVTPDSLAPDVQPARSEVYFAGSGVQLLSVHNRGGADATLSGMTSGDPRVTLGVDRLTVPPGETALLQVTFTDDTDGAVPLDASVCIASDDPDAPVQEIVVASESEGSSILIGEPAPDFVLPDLDGKLWTLSDHIGHPVVLVYFATW